MVETGVGGGGGGETGSKYVQRGPMALSKRVIEIELLRNKRHTSVLGMEK